MRFADAFAARPVGPGFALWGRRHLSALAVTSASLTGIVVLGRRLGPRGRRRVRTVLASAGAKPADVVRVRTYVVNHTPDKLGVVLPELVAFFGADAPPPNTFIGVAALALPDFLIEIEATAALA